MEVEKNDEGYKLKNLTVDGQELDREEVYSVAVIGSVTLMLQDALEEAGVTEYSRWETDYEQIIVECLLKGKQLAKPNDYITLK